MRLISTNSLALALCATSAAYADVPALTITGGVGTVGHANNSATTLGWQFELSTAVTVTALGYYDGLGDGLAEAHDVGIFNGAGSLVVSTTVPAGTSATLVASTRYVPIAPIVLAAGSYTMAGTIGATASDQVLYQVNNPAFASGVSGPAAASRYTEAGAYTMLTYPNLNWPPANYYLGPNFQLAAVPELPTFAYLLLGLLLFGQRVRVKRPAQGVQHAAKA